MLAAFIMGLGGAWINRSFGGIAAVRSVTDPSDASCEVRFFTTGAVAIFSGTGTVSNWGYPVVADLGARFWLRVTPTSGSFTSNPASSWVALTSNRTITRERTTVGTNSVTFTIEIATDAAGSNVVATWTGNTMQATVEP